MKKVSRIFVLLTACGAWLFHTPLASAQSRDAEPATRAPNDFLVKWLPFSDRADFDDVKRGFIATLPDGARELFGLLDDFTPDFEIVEPKKASVE